MNARDYIVYEKASGKIIRHGYASAQTTILPPSDAYAILETDGSVTGATHFVRDGKVVAKGASTAVCDKTEVVADGTDLVTLTGLPVPCQLQLAGAHLALYDVDEDVVELSFSVVGTHVLTIASITQLDKTIIIHAH